MLQGLNRESLARRVGRTGGFLGELEREEARASEDTLKALASALKVPYPPLKDLHDRMRTWKDREDATGYE